MVSACRIIGIKIPIEGVRYRIGDLSRAMLTKSCAWLEAEATAPLGIVWSLLRS